MLSYLTDTPKPRPMQRARSPRVGFCGIKQRLMDDFIATIHEMTTLQSQQMHAVVEGDSDFSRFDLLIHFAQERKDLAKYAWIAHVESHDCGEA
jgi:hypothetical protein